MTVGTHITIPGVILSIDENDMYVIGSVRHTRVRVLSGKYSRNKFSLCPQPLLKVVDLHTVSVSSLREGVKALPVWWAGFNSPPSAIAQVNAQQTDVL
jgi:hypothetical protein